MLRERTQRRLFRLLFVLGCVLPTLAVAGYTARRLTPGFHDSLLASASDRLGVPIRCETLRTPRPGVFELTGVRLGDADEAHATCDRVTLAAVTGVWRAELGDVVIESSDAAASLLWSLVEADAVAAARADTVEVGGERLERVSMRVARGEDDDRSIQLHTSRRQSVTIRFEQGVWRVAASTGDASIPATWLGSLPAPASVLAAGRFTGDIEAEADHGIARGSLDLKNVDADGLNAAHGSVRSFTASWSEDRLDSFAGRLALRDGSLTRALVEGAAWWLTLKPFDGLVALHSKGTTSFPFTQLACDIQLDASGLKLTARNDEIDGRTRGGAVAHAIVEHEGEPLLGEPIEPSLPTGRLVQAWFSSEQAELPSSPAAIEMARRLPAVTMQ